MSQFKAWTHLYTTFHFTQTHPNNRSRSVWSTDLLTYLLTPWCRVLLEQLTGLQLVKKFPAFHGTRRFITAPTSVRHLSLYLSSPIRSMYPHPTSWRSILILSTHLRLGLPSGLGRPRYHHTSRCDDTRGSVMQFWPPDDEHMCSKHVEAWNKTYCETNFVHQVG